MHDSTSAVKLCTTRPVHRGCGKQYHDIFHVLAILAEGPGRGVSGHGVALECARSRHLLPPIKQLLVGLVGPLLELHFARV